MKIYSYRNYEELLFLLTETYDFEVDYLHRNIAELYIQESPMMRIIYDAGLGTIAVSFHILIPGNQAIMIFDFLRGNYKKIGLSDIYYENDQGETFMGTEAMVRYEHDREFESTIEGFDSVSSYRSKFPVSIVIGYPLYEATHPKAKEEYRAYLNRKRIL